MEAKKALVRKNFDGSAEFARTVITNLVYFVSGVYRSAFWVSKSCVPKITKLIKIGVTSVIQEVKPGVAIETGEFFTFVRNKASLL